LIERKLLFVVLAGGPVSRFPKLTAFHRSNEQTVSRSQVKMTRRVRVGGSTNILSALKKEQAQLAKKLEGIVAANRSIGWATEEDSEDERCGEEKDPRDSKEELGMNTRKKTVQRTWGRRFLLMVENRQEKVLHTILGVALSVAQYPASHAQNSPFISPRTMRKTLKTL
jgi:hypothetical protein